MKQVIIAENILQNVENSDTLFKRGGLTVYPARSCEEILVLHRTHNVDLIISDFALPQMGGEKLCSLIRADTRLKDVSLLVVCNAAAVTECRSAGANAVLSAPIDSIELFSRVSELLLISQRQDMRAFLHVSIVDERGRLSFLGVSHNISISGMLLETEKELKIGERLLCTFCISAREIAADVIVTREVQVAAGKFRYGVKFLNLDTKSLIIINQFVMGRIKH